MIGDYQPEQSEQYVSGPVPNLFEPAGIEDREIPRVDAPLAQAASDTENGEKNTTSLTRIKDWFSGDSN